MHSFGTVSLRGKASTYPKLYVELQFNHYGNKFLIKRKTGDASLFMFDEGTLKFIEVATSTTGVNSKIISLLGYDYNIYVLSNYCQQGKLQYFSELTPAKRLQFIDKVSGIEDAKELVDWLTAKRKSLKNTLDTLKDMIHQPTLSDGIDLDVNYDELISELDQDNSEINNINTNIRQLRSNLKPVPSVPREPTKTDILLAAISTEQLEQVDNYLCDKEDMEERLAKVKDHKKSLQTCPTSLQSIDLSLEEATSLLNQIMMNSLTDTNISCPSCSHNFCTSILKDTSHKLSHISVRDLSNYIEWKQPDVQKEHFKTDRSIEGYVKALKTLSVEDYLQGMQLPVTDLETLPQAVRRATETIRSYETITAEREQALDENNKINNEIESLEEKLDTLLHLQKSVSNLKSEYVAKKVEKDLYLKQLDIYHSSLELFNTNKKEFELIQTMLKSINEITNKIKLETIPLINHHASNYLNIMTKGVMNNIEITENYDLIVDGHSINLRSGAQKDLSSLAFRLSLGQSIILGMLPLFIGDEIDASSPPEVAGDITEALETISSKGYQILMITHKDVTNLEDCHIIDLG